MLSQDSTTIGNTAVSLLTLEPKSSQWQTGQNKTKSWVCQKSKGRKMKNIPLLRSPSPRDSHQHRFLCEDRGGAQSEGHEQFCHKDHSSTVLSSTTKVNNNTNYTHVHQPLLWLKLDKGLHYSRGSKTKTSRLSAYWGISTWWLYIHWITAATITDSSFSFLHTNDYPPGGYIYTGLQLQT